MISNHLHPQLGFHRWIGRLAVLSMFGVIIGTLGFIAMAFLYQAGLMLVMIPFLWGLSLPLFLLTSLYPGVVVYEQGVELQPFGFRPSQLAWDDLVAITEHTMLKPAPPSKLRRTAQTGTMIIVQSDKLPFPYKIVGLIAGIGWKPVFAISNKTHTDYESLLAVFEDRLPHRELNDV